MVLCTSEQGYSETTIGDVVRVARTSRSAFYEHFTDKEACFLAAYAQMTGAFIKASLDAAARVDSWERMLEAGILTYFRFMAEHPEVAVSTVVEIHSAGRAGLKARNRALRQWMGTIEGVALLARREGVQIPELGEAGCAAIVLTAEAYVHEYARRNRVRKVQEKAPDVLALARTLFEHGVSAAGEIAPASPSAVPVGRLPSADDPRDEAPADGARDASVDGRDGGRAGDSASDEAASADGASLG
jgi:AcrR family transcriptional regulator